MRNTEVLLLLGRKSSNWELGGREPYFLGCTSLKWSLLLAELEEGKEVADLSSKTRDSYQIFVDSLE